MFSRCLLGRCHEEKKNAMMQDPEMLKMSMQAMRNPALMEAVNPMMRMIEERHMSIARFPIRSIKAPKNGLAMAEMMYGTPKSYPAFTLSNPYFFCSKSEQF